MIENLIESAPAKALAFVIPLIIGIIQVLPKSNNKRLVYRNTIPFSDLKAHMLFFEYYIDLFCVLLFIVIDFADLNILQLVLNEAEENSYEVASVIGTVTVVFASAIIIHFSNKNMRWGLAINGVALLLSFAIIDQAINFYLAASALFNVILYYELRKTKLFEKHFKYRVKVNRKGWLQNVDILRILDIVVISLTMFGDNYIDDVAFFIWVILSSIEYLMLESYNWDKYLIWEMSFSSGEKKYFKGDADLIKDMIVIREMDEDYIFPVESISYIKQNLLRKASCFQVTKNFSVNSILDGSWVLIKDIINDSEYLMESGKLMDFIDSKKTKNTSNP